MLRSKGRSAGPVSTSPTASSISPLPTPSRRLHERHFAGVTGLVLVAFDDLSLGPELRYEPSRGSDLFPASLRPARSGGGALGQASAAVGRRAAHLPGPSTMSLAFRLTAAPCLCHRPGDRRTDWRCSGLPQPDWCRTGRRPIRAWPAACSGSAFPNPVGLAAGFDKNADGDRRDACRRIWLHRIGTLTPRPQAGNPRPRDISPALGLRGHQPHGLQQRRLRRRRAPAAADGSRAASSASISAPIATAPTAWPIMSPASGASRRWPTTSPSTSPRQIRRACATCRSASR